MSAPAGGWVSNEVISTKLDALYEEVRLMRREQVRQDVYEAQRQADLLRIKSLETSLESAAADKRRVNYALLGAGLSLLVALVAPVLGIGGG